MTKKDSIGGVRVILIRHGRIVLARHWLSSSVWTLPGGGIKKGETVAQAGRREIREEIGYHIKSFGGVLGIYKGRPGVKRDDVAVLYTKNFIGSMKLLPNHEIMERSLFSLNRLPKNVSPANRRRIEAYKKGVRGERTHW